MKPQRFFPKGSLWGKTAAFSQRDRFAGPLCHPSKKTSKKKYLYNGKINKSLQKHKLRNFY